MSDTQKFSFSDSSIAGVYDSVLVPILFQPWAARLVEEHQPWEGRRVLDIATGSGIFAQLVAAKVGPDGTVHGIDINTEMLALAKKRCEGIIPEVKFTETAAHSLKIPGDSIDYVVCQQGFQFFPDKDGAAREMYRVLCAGGKAVISTWRSVTECQYFGTICHALNTMDEQEISDMMRLPFDFMPESQLAGHFEEAGFSNVRVSRQEQNLFVRGGVKDATEVAYATPIRQKLLALPDERQAEFRNILSELISDLSSDGITMGRMVSNVLTGEKEA